MTPDGRNTDYDAFAWFYNRYWSKRLIDRIFWTIDDYLLKRLKPGSHILDICCGNGHLAAKMSSKSFRVTGIDASGEMLRYAHINSPETIYHVMDARDFNLNEKFDAATSTCDSLNHIMTIDELKKVFANVHSALKPDGRFLFDLNTEEGYKKYWTGQTGGRSEDDNAFIIKLTYDENVKQSAFEATMFRIMEGQWKRSDARLTQQYYPPDQVFKLLEENGFRDVKVYDVEKDLGVDGTGRTMFVTQKG